MTILGEHNSYIAECMNILENFMWTYVFMGVSFEPSTKRLMAQQGKGEWEEGRKVYPGKDVCHSPSSFPMSCVHAGSSPSITLPHLQHAYTYLTYGLQSIKWAAQRSFLLQNTVQNLCGMLAKSICQEQSTAVWLAWNRPYLLSGVLGGESHRWPLSRAFNNIPWDPRKLCFLKKQTTWEENLCSLWFAIGDRKEWRRKKAKICLITVTLFFICSDVLSRSCVCVESGGMYNGVWTGAQGTDWNLMRSSAETNVATLAFFFLN